MKKLLILLGLLLLTGCVNETTIDEEQKKDPIEVDVTPLEILTDVYEVAGVDMLPNIETFNKDDESSLKLRNIINNGEEIKDFEAAVINEPMMAMIANLVFIIQLSSDETVTDIEEKLEVLKTYFVCAVVGEYEIVSNGNYVMFAGLLDQQDNEKIVDAFKSIETKKEESSELKESTALSVLNQIYKKADINMLSTITTYKAKEDVSYMIDGENEVVLENFVSAVLSKPSEYNDPRLVFIIELSSTDNIDLIGEGLHWMTNYYSFLDVAIEEYEIINNGNFIMFAGTDANKELVNAFIELDL